MTGSPTAIEALLPDLLELEPRARVKLASLDRAADFAFASAGTFTEIDNCLDRVEHGPSAWDPSSFDRALFVADMVERCFPIVIGGVAYAPSRRHLEGLVSRPPRDRAVVRFRQGVLSELAARPELRRAAEETYVRIRRLRELLGAKETSELPAPARRRMETLSVVRAIYEGLVAGFEGAESGLARLRETGQRVTASKGFADLVSLLDLEQNLATIDTRVRIGGDGALRSLEIVAVKENQGNRYFEPPLQRLWRRLWRAFRGYAFRDDDVRDAVVDAVFAGVRREVVKLFQLAGDLEFYLASLGFRDHVRQRGLEACLPEIAPAGSGARRHLEGLFNPHLLSDHKAPVPCSLSFERHDAIAIFTGPNSGGKTRLLQAVALAQMLGQAGSFVPAKAASIVWAEGMFVSLIEEARHDQKEGRLGTELMRIREVFERLRPGGLVLLDELCSGTNPSEGQEIFELVTDLLTGLEPQAFITTHFLDFAAKLEASSHGGRLCFLQVALDDHDEPTYQFVPGVARSSLARKTAARLGVTRESLLALVERARAGQPREKLLVPLDDVKAEAGLDDLADLAHP